MRYPIALKFGACEKAYKVHLGNKFGSVQASVAELEMIIHEKWHQYVVIPTG